nr:LUD domain-containing protein [uncultured Holophaga sp.]
MSRVFAKRVTKALENPNLGGILDRWNYPATRAKAFEGIDFEALRTEIAGIKGEAAGRLPELAQQFQKAAEAKGARVLRASSPQEVLDYILRLCQAKGIKRVAKSKSMASEEIHLNEFLAEHGIQADETDLGEWICQLAHQKPSHMVMPALHLTKEEVADLFSAEVKQVLDPEIQGLVKVARRELREKFFEADLGVTGANIAIAETGTLVLMTNEGNARLVSTLPKTHVAIVGIEKLVPHFRDAAPILRALPRNATSQLITSYVSMITGPVPNDDGTMKDLHIILMDNQRTAMAADPEFKQALQCIRCASCLNVCPVYRLVGGHVFGHIYTGGIGTILTAWFNELKTTEDIQALCIGCGKCNEVCAAKIDIAGLILELRRRLGKKEGLPFIQKTALQIINNRKLFHAMLRAASLAQKPFAKDGFIRHLPMFLSNLAEHRSLPAIAERPFRDLFPGIQQPKGREKAVFYAGCAIDFISPRVGVALVKVLNQAGIEVLFPQAQSCCGIPHWASGADEMAALAAAHNVGPLDVGDADYVVTACATCASAVEKEWPHLLRKQGMEGLAQRAEAVAAKSLMFTELVNRLIREGRLRAKDGLELQRVTYHDSCHAKRHLGLSKEPRAALEAAGYEMAEMAEADTCCGMGGSYTVKQPDISMGMLKRKLENAQATGARFLCAECPGCLLQLGGGLDKAGAPMQARHPAELLAERLEGPEHD